MQCSQHQTLQPRTPNDALQCHAGQQPTSAQPTPQPQPLRSCDQGHSITPLHLQRPTLEVEAEGCRASTSAPQVQPSLYCTALKTKKKQPHSRWKEDLSPTQGYFNFPLNYPGRHFQLHFSTSAATAQPSTLQHPWPKPYPIPPTMLRNCAHLHCTPHFMGTLLGLFRETPHAGRRPEPAKEVCSSQVLHESTKQNQQLLNAWPGSGRCAVQHAPLWPCVPHLYCSDNPSLAPPLIPPHVLSLCTFLTSGAAN